jgi:hypothetical protein
MGLTVVDRILSDFFCKIWLHNNANPTEFRIFVPELLTSINYTKEKNWVNIN